MTKQWWLIAAIFTFITILAWVTFDVLHARTQVEIPQALQEVIEPIDPNLNIQSLE